MKVIKCEIGHYYDSDTYGTYCPHCQELADKEIKPTTLMKKEKDDENQLPVTETRDSTVSWKEYEDLPVEWEFEGDNSVTYNSECFTTVGRDDGVLTEKWYSAEGVVEPVSGWLVCIKGKCVGKSYNLKTGRNYIGRGSNMDVILEGDTRISRNKHGIITYEPRSKMFFIQPGESAELFYVNELVVLNTLKLNPYDKILMGSTELLFVPFCSENFAWEESEKASS